MPNVVITPQIGGFVAEYEDYVMPILIVENMRLFLAGAGGRCATSCRIRWKMPGRFRCSHQHLASSNVRTGFIRMFASSQLRASCPRCEWRVKGADFC